MSTKKRAARKAPAKTAPRQKRQRKSRLPMEKMVLAAYHTICGDKDVDVAQRLGVTDRTIRNWRSSSKWAEALSIAEKRWFPATRHAAMATIGRSIKRGNVQVAQWFAERQIPELAPPKVRNEHSGPDGKPIPHAATVTVYMPDNGRGGS